MRRPDFYVGFSRLNHAHEVDRVMISVTRLLTRRKKWRANKWMMDSGAFSFISRGLDHIPAERYAHIIRQWSNIGELQCAVAQDYMCEPEILLAREMTIRDHQVMTIRRYDQLKAIEPVGVPIMPVIQGYEIRDYLWCMELYGDRLTPHLWVGVGSLCKRNRNHGTIEAILEAIKKERPDLKLHGFGIKTTALKNAYVAEMLESCDSASWSYAARRRGRPSDRNDPLVARRFAERIQIMPMQMSIFQGVNRV